VPHLAVLAAVTTGAGVVMIRLGFSKGHARVAEGRSPVPVVRSPDRGPRVPDLYRAEL